MTLLRNWSRGAHTGRGEEWEGEFITEEEEHNKKKFLLRREKWSVCLLPLGRLGKSEGDIRSELGGAQNALQRKSKRSRTHFALFSKFQQCRCACELIFQGKFNKRRDSEEKQMTMQTDLDFLESGCRTDHTGMTRYGSRKIHTVLTPLDRHTTAWRFEEPGWEHTLLRSLNSSRRRQGTTHGRNRVQIVTCCSPWQRKG